jgi:hypothetical protein
VRGIGLHPTRTADGETFACEKYRKYSWIRHAKDCGLSLDGLKQGSEPILHLIARHLEVPMCRQRQAGGATAP